MIVKGEAIVSLELVEGYKAGLTADLSQTTLAEIRGKAAHLASDWQFGFYLGCTAPQRYRSGRPAKDYRES